MQPWWTFPSGVVGRSVSLLGRLHAWHLPLWALILWVIVMGTIVPFALIVSALRHLPATRVGIVAMLEPVAAGVVAWAWLGESLNAAQLGAGQSSSRESSWPRTGEMRLRGPPAFRNDSIAYRAKALGGPFTNLPRLRDRSGGGDRARVPRASCKV